MKKKDTGGLPSCLKTKIKTVIRTIVRIQHDD